ncbi:Sphingomyelin phosphodiesterase 4 [Holothuria leucospilota]|uniref:Sphingomyelin phosphodiesterase 4 n=1 Tax=Holothuria leucospilota TaxID=206669 RepID=A0A9Q1CEY7_HOLLE|nr:Sphingomyelin phosphodiesterase 4 [Holothuria leucospilota]
MAGQRFQNFLSRRSDARSPNGSTLSRNNSLTVHDKINLACQRPFLKQKCYELETILQRLTSKELHSIFPFLLDNIFGYNGKLGWGLHQLTAFSNPEDFHVVTTFLGPEGALMNAVYKQQADPYLKFDFLLSNLPNQVKENFERGNIPVFYQNKLNRSLTSLQLNPFEYFIFNFAYFIVCPANQKFFNNWTTPEECCYPNLLDRYLCFLLPYDGRPVPPIPAGLTSPTLSQSSGHSPSYRLPQYGVLYDYLQSGNLERSPLIRDEASSFYNSSPSMYGQYQLLHGGGASQEGETWRSEVFVQILVEFWLNQNTLTTQNKSLFRQVQENYIPSLDHVRVVRILVKHLHFFSNSASRDLSPYKQSPDTLDGLKRCVIPLLLQKPLYVFLRHGFDHWPLDVSFRQILEVWLSYIQPWRYDADAILRESQSHHSMIGLGQRSPAREQRAMKVEDERWRKFISENVPMFTVLFQEFVPRVLRQDLSNAKNALMVFRVAKVFGQPHLADLLQEAEDQLMEAMNQGNLQKSFSSTSSFLSSSQSYQGHHHHHHQHNFQILALEGPDYVYKPLFGPMGEYQVTQLLQVIGQAKAILSSLSRVQLSGIGEDISDWLNLDSWFGGHSPTQGHAALIDDMGPMHTHKAGTYLDQTSKFLAKTFQVQPPEAVDTDDRQDPYSRKQRHLPPDTNEEGQLTDLGRHQMANGFRHFEVEYLGDPDLQPIRTYESATLVRLLFRVCSVINQKYGNEITEWYLRPDYRGAVAKQYFHAPAVSPRSRKKPSTFVSCRLDHKPRLSLRFLASYRMIFYIFLFLFFAHLLGFSVHGVIFMVLVYILLYGLIGGAVHYMRQDDYHTLSS